MHVPPHHIEPGSSVLNHPQHHVESPLQWTTHHPLLHHHHVCLHCSWIFSATSILYTPSIHHFKCTEQSSSCSWQYLHLCCHSCVRLCVSVISSNAIQDPYVQITHQFFSFLPFYNICILAFLTAHPSSLSPPTNVAANQLSPTSASISWNPPLQTPNFYFICYFPIELGGSAQFGFAFGIVSSHDVTGLNQGGTYVFIVVSAAATLSAADPVALTL